MNDQVAEARERKRLDEMLSAIGDELECINISHARAFKGAPTNEDGDKIPKRRKAREHNREIMRRLAAIWAIIAECGDAMTNGEFDNLTTRMRPLLKAEHSNMTNWITAEATVASQNVKDRLIGKDTEPCPNIQDAKAVDAKVEVDAEVEGSASAEEEHGQVGPA